MSTVSQVGEIFAAAGTAFLKLGELTSLLQVDEHAPVVPGEKWDEEDLEQLRVAVKRFGEDLNRLTERIKDKNNHAAKNGVKKRKFEEAGIKVTNNNNIVTTIKPVEEMVVAQGNVSV